MLGLSSRPPLSVVDLFAGCGGLSLGLETAGFTPVMVNELSPDAMATYLDNRPELDALWKKYRIQDIKALVANEEDLLEAFMKDMAIDYGIDPSQGDLDLVVGGPPCQGYSGIGHRRSYSVDRASLPSNHLYQDMARVIFRMRPKAFLFENVRGLLSARWTSSGAKGEIWEDVLRTMTSIPGYRVVGHALVHASDFGVPQNRPRVIIVGIRDDIRAPDQRSSRGNGLIPDPTQRAPDLIDVLGDLVDLDYVPGSATARYPSEPLTVIQRRLRTDRAGDVVAPIGAVLSEQEYSDHTPAITRKFAYMLANDGRIPDDQVTKKFAQRVLPERWGPKGPSITVTSLPDDYVHFNQPRTVTVREWARMQTFPDWYTFAGKRTTGGLRRAGNPQVGSFDRELPKYTQIGNAVPVWMANALGRHIAAILGVGAATNTAAESGQLVAAG